MLGSQGCTSPAATLKLEGQSKEAAFDIVSVVLGHVKRYTLPVLCRAGFPRPPGGVEGQLPVLAA